VGAHYRQRRLRTPVWPILQSIYANTGNTRNHWDRLFFGKQTGLGHRRAFLSVGHGCHALVLLPLGCDHDIYGQLQGRQSALRRISSRTNNGSRQRAASVGGLFHRTFGLNPNSSHFRATSSTLAVIATVRQRCSLKSPWSATTPTVRRRSRSPSPSRARHENPVQVRKMGGAISSAIDALMTVPTQADRSLAEIDDLHGAVLVRLRTWCHAGPCRDPARIREALQAYC
jgi:hypothetical protein